MITAVNVMRELEDMGFKGKQLKDLGSIIKTQDHLDEFEIFIIENEDIASEISLVSEFRKHIIGKDLMDKPTFIMEYSYSISMKEKQEVLYNLSKTNVDKRWVEELDKALHRDVTTLGSFYDAFILEPTLHIRRMILESIEINSEKVS